MARKIVKVIGSALPTSAALNIQKVEDASKASPAYRSRYYLTSICYFIISLAICMTIAVAITTLVNDPSLTIQTA